MNSEMWGGPEDGRVHNIHAGQKIVVIPQPNMTIWSDGGGVQVLPGARYEWNRTTGRFEFRDWLYE